MKSEDKKTFMAGANAGSFISCVLAMIFHLILNGDIMIVLAVAAVMAAWRFFYD